MPWDVTCSQTVTPQSTFCVRSPRSHQESKNNFFICSTLPYQSSQTPLSVGLWYTQDWPFIFKTRDLVATFCPTPWGDVMAQTSSRSSWARCGETSSTGSLNQGQWRAWWWKNSPTSQCSPGKKLTSPFGIAETLPLASTRHIFAQLRLELFDDHMLRRVFFPGETATRPLTGDPEANLNAEMAMVSSNQMTCLKVKIYLDSKLSQLNIGNTNH